MKPRYNSLTIIITRGDNQSVLVFTGDRHHERAMRRFRVEVMKLIREFRSRSKKADRMRAAIALWFYPKPESRDSVRMLPSMTINR